MHISNPLVPLMLMVQKISYGKKCKFYGLPIIAKRGGENLYRR